jgi:hypothetical protein
MLPERTNIYGEHLTANASKTNLSDMHHKQGYVLSPEENLGKGLIYLAKEFTRKNPNCPLTKKDYNYKEEILKMRE